MSVSLINTTRRLAVFILTHGDYCAALGRCVCDRRRDGALLPGALTLPASSRASDLPAAVLTLPMVQAAVRAGTLRVEHMPSPPEPAPEVVVPPGGPAGAPITPIEVPDERRAAVVQGRRR